MRTLVRCAHAKINLGLRVGPKRPDGFHEVATALLAISLHDRLAFTPRARGGVTLTVDGPEARGVPSGATNLVVRAAHALAAELGEQRGVTIRLTKGIPHGAGLGGGSSDAAATLRSLLALWQRRLAPARLRALAAALGSDVPFFLGPGFALATGRGEILRPLAPPPGTGTRALRIVVVVPEASVSTRWAYANHVIPKSRLTGFGHAATLVQLRAEGFARKRVKPKLTNDLEEVVRSRIHVVPRAMRDLRRAGARHVRMSGSGSAVFGLVPSSISPRVVVQRLRKSYARVYAVRPVGTGSRPCR